VPGEGKTTVSVDLAHAYALTGRRVILVELDLRRPSFTAHFDIDGRRGVTTALTGAASLDHLLVEPFEDLPELSVLPSGVLPPNPSELLGSQATVELMRDLRAEGALVILDAPPLNPVADTQVLLNVPGVDGAVIVARVGKTTRDEARRARAILDRHVVAPLGLVVTGLEDPDRYGYATYEMAPASGEGLTLHEPVPPVPPKTATRRSR
jgi:receptor protein-tyrosine kinase